MTTADDARYPGDFRFHPEHGWAWLDGELATCGITWFAQESLGDVVFLRLPDLDEVIEAGTPYGDVESVKAVSDLVAPVTGRVVAVNRAAVDDPAVVNSDPFGAGWLVRVRLDRSGPPPGLLDAAGYRRVAEG